MTDSIQPKHSDHFSDLKTEVALLKRDISFITTLFDKMDKIINKIEDQQENIVEKTNILIEHKAKCTKEEMDDLYNALEKTERTIHNRIDIIEKMISNETQKIHDTLSDHIATDENIINKFNKIIYTVAGGFAIFVWIINNLDIVKKIFG